MAQITRGVRSVLSIPVVYSAFQLAVGSDKIRRKLVQQYVPDKPGTRVLDIGCGPGVLVEALPTGCEYTGIDLSEKYVAAARQRYGGRGRFLQGRVDDLSPSELGQFDVVIAKSILHHLDEVEALHLFSVAAKVLADGGRLITSDAAYTDDMSRASRFVVSKDRGQTILTPEGYERLARKEFSDVEVRVHHDLLRIPYTHVTMSCGTAPVGKA